MKINTFLIICVFSLCLTPLIWFINKPDYLINGVDTNFPLNPAIWFFRRLFVWNDVQNAGADFSSSTAGLFFHFIQYLPYQLGLSLQMVEIFSFLFWFSVLIIGSFVLARQWFPKQSLVQLLFVCLYAFNIYLFNTWENVKVANLSLVSSLPFALALLWSHFQYGIKKPRLLFSMALISLLLSGSGINPAYFSVFFLVLVIYCVAEIITAQSKRKVVLVIKAFLTFLIVSILVNAYWIFPTINFIFKNISQEQSLSSIGFNNWVDSLSTNTSIVNIWRLMGAWDWYAFDNKSGLPLYIPYALNYFFKLPFIAFSFLIPTLALAAFMLYEKKLKVLYLGFGLMTVLGIVLGTGTHHPTGAFYQWLGQNLPFFSLFRSPWYIFTPLLVIGLSGLVCLFFSNLLSSNRIIFSHKKTLINGLIVLTIIGNLFYCYPLVTGKIFRPQSDDGFYVRFPDYVFQASNWLKDAGIGRVISYPDDEIEKFNWGYRGVESILGLVSNVEVLNKSLNATQTPEASLINKLYVYLKKDQIDLANSLLNHLNVDSLFYKRDQSSLSPDLSSKITNLPKTEIGQWQFYQLADGPRNKIFIPNKIFTIQNKDRTSDVLALIDKDAIIIDQKDSLLPKIIGQNTSNEIITTENSHQSLYKKYFDNPDFAAKLIPTDLSTLTFNFTVSNSGQFQPILEKYKLEDFGLDYSKGLEMIINNTKYNLVTTKVTDSLVYFNEINLQSGTYQVILPIKITNSIYGGDMSKGFSFKLNRNGRFNLEKEHENDYLSIINRDVKDAGATFEVPNLDPFGVYLIQVRYKQIYGNYAQVNITQTNGDVLFKSQSESFPNYPEWNDVHFFFVPVQVKQSLVELKLVAPETKDPLGTKVAFDDLRFYKVFTNQLFFIRKDQTANLATAAVEYQKISPVEYRGQVKNIQGRHILSISEQYSPDWVLTLTTNDGKASQAIGDHFTAQSCCNAWYIEDSPKDYNFVIYYWPQKVFYFGTAVATLSLILTFGYFLYGIRRKS